MGLGRCQALDLYVTGLKLPDFYAICDYAVKKYTKHSYMDREGGVGIYFGKAGNFCHIDLGIGYPRGRRWTRGSPTSKNWHQLWTKVDLPKAEKREEIA